ncbi:DL-endopeptidase inhibitor IseA family protein [Paenibacillus planticolens]|uniref:Copper amine oxidase-like N-terminal domain-containing protein n=1 Tax=Paenibacillus planticolens TaxID=2654976 RepID=A0ABX1ZJB6_9BACL|nr:DL-endopeptidase inhibitor IseA family protein [Paenibacillus planticolens]NOU98739.1 hypothetical protein [Paenibacillus planticolens]
MVNWNWKSFVSGIVVGTLAFSVVSYASPNTIKLIVNGSELYTEVPAQIINGSTMIPARGLAEALGAFVTWDPGNQAVIVESDPFTKLTDMNPKRAVQLAGLAQKLYWVVGRGGTQHPEGPVKTFTVKGKQHEFRWMGDDLNSKEKLIAFLEKIYTSEQVAAFWNQLVQAGDYIEVDNKLAQVNADGGSLMSWGDSTAVLLKDSIDEKTYHYTVPVGNNQVEQKDIKVRFVEGKGWRIDSPITEIH